MQFTYLSVPFSYKYGHILLAAADGEGDEKSPGFA